MKIEISISFPILSQGRQDAVKQIYSILLITVRQFLANQKLIHLAFRLYILFSQSLQKIILKNCLLPLFLLEVTAQHHFYRPFLRRMNYLFSLVYYFPNRLMPFLQLSHRNDVDWFKQFGLNLFFLRANLQMNFGFFWFVSWGLIKLSSFDWGVWLGVKEIT